MHRYGACFFLYKLTEQTLIRRKGLLRTDHEVIISEKFQMILLMIYGRGNDDFGRRMRSMHAYGEGRKLGEEDGGDQCFCSVCG